MSNDEVLAARLPHHPWIASIAADIGADRLPQMLESLRRAGEMDAREIRVLQCYLRNVKAIAWQHVDHSGRQSRRLQELHGEVRGKLLGWTRLPDDYVAHQCWRRRQIAGNRGEVERSNGVHEALERAIVGLVPHARR